MMRGPSVSTKIVLTTDIVRVPFEERWCPREASLISRCQCSGVVRRRVLEDGDWQH